MCTTRAFADYQFVHTPPSLQELPAPGKPMKLSVALPKEALGVGLKMRALVSRDGRIMDLTDTDPSIDTNDRVIFKVEFPSPLSDIGYQFIFTDKTGATFGSKRYLVQRKCIPNVQSTTLRKQASGGTVTKEEAMHLLADSSGLQKDIELYEQISSLLNDLNQAVNKK